MKIEVRFFAVGKDLTGTERLDVELPEGSGGEDLWNELVSRFPRLKGLKSRIRLAVNMEYVSNKVRLNDGDQVSLIPPVSGG